MRKMGQREQRTLRVVSKDELRLRLDIADEGGEKLECDNERTHGIPGIRE